MKKIKVDISDHSRRHLVIFFSIVFFIALIGIGLRVIAEVKLSSQTNDSAILGVSITSATPAPAIEEIVLPGSVQAWHEAPVYARTNGYIKTWYTDIGTRVKNGELLAVIETPELNAELRQAEADLKTAEANNQVAQTTAIRWKALLKTESVSKQETDERVADALARAALVNAARANRDRLRELVDFEQVIAPFEGIITLRTIDIGSLIAAGTTQRPLFRIAQADPLRIYVRIPQAYSSRVSPTMQVELHFAEHPGKVYAAKLYQTAEAIDPVSRTLLAQFTAQNKNYELLPGGYTQVHLKFPSYKNSVRLPVNTLLFRAQGLQVATIDKNNKVILKSIKVAKDFGNAVQVDDGLKPGEQIIINPNDSLFNGEQVKIVNTVQQSDGDNQE